MVRTTTGTDLLKFLLLPQPWIWTAAWGVYLMSQSIPREIPPVAPVAQIPAPQAALPVASEKKDGGGASASAVSLIVTPMAPADRAHVPFSSGFAADIEFQWEFASSASLQGGSYPAPLLDISKDALFSDGRTETRRLTSAAKGSVVVGLTPEHYYWRVHVEGKPASEVRELWVEAVPPPQKSGSHRSARDLACGTKSQKPEKGTSSRRFEKGTDRGF